MQYLAAMSDLDDLDEELDDLEAELDSDEEDEEELKHYASPYYDPQKAHEYYEAHKQLKGRTSTAGLNEKGREAAKYVKESLTTERKGKVESLRSENKMTVESHKNQMQGKIDTLRSRLKSMSKADKAAHREEIKNEIASLRAENREERKRLSEELKSASAQLRTEYDEKYVEELDRMKADPEFQAVKKGKGGKSSGKKTNAKRHADQW